MSHQPLKPLQASLLNILWPGLGHLYVGRIRRYFGCLAAFLVLYAILGVTGLLAKSFAAFLVVLVTAVAMIVFLVIDAALLARGTAAFRPPWYAQWYGYVLFIAFSAVCSVVVKDVRVRWFGADVFRVPSDSMLPTIAQGDYIMVGRLAFDVRAPTEREVVVIRDQRSGNLYVRRVSQALLPSEVQVVQDNPPYGEQSRQISQVPISDVLGQVTYVWFSDEISRVGHVPR